MGLNEREVEKLRLGALTAIDGLWFLAAERTLGFDKALKMDIEVWQSYGLIMLKRAARLMGVEIGGAAAPDIATINDLLVALCAIDGTECTAEAVSEDEAEFTVHRCSWWENLKKAGRQDAVPCELVDNMTFARWLEAADESLEMAITHSMPRGDGYCSWRISRKP